MRDFALQLAREAGRMLMEACGTLSEQQIDFKGRRDMVTAADRAVEGFLTERIAAECPSDGILAEESIQRAGRSGRVWILDPLDGTTNFVHGHPMFCVSIALAEGYAGIPDPEQVALDQRASGFFDPQNPITPHLGVVHAPALGELYWAETGAGAHLGDRAIHVSGTGDLARSLVATGLPYRRNELANNNLANFARVALQVQGIRRGGAASLDLAYVAAGRFDGFWELYLKPWDVAAAMVLVREAGGRVTDLGGADRAIEGVEVLASNGHLHAELSGLLEGADPSWAAAERARKWRSGPPG